MKTLIYGSGATARLIVRFAPYVHGVIEDYPSHQPAGSPLLNRPTLKLPQPDCELIIGVGYQHGEGGMNKRREEIAEIGCPLASVIFSFGVRNIGTGCVVLPGTILHDNSCIGRNCFIASNVTVGHDVCIGDHSWVNSGVALDGSAIVGRRCVIGANAVIGAGVKLGERVLIGPGAVVLRDVPDGGVVLAPESVLHRFNSSVFGRMK